jgi:SAM-dependent methyltransferase
MVEKIRVESASPMTNNYILPLGWLLHVGCGPITPTEWVNLDASWNLLAARVPGLRRMLRATGLISKGAEAHAWADHIRYCDVTRGLPFRDGQAAVVYASHVLEHVSRRDARNLMRETYRVLAPGGIARFVVPDLERLARWYLAQQGNGNGNGNANAANEFMEHLRTCPDYSDAAAPLKVYRKFLDTLSHKWMYDTTSLKELMADAGFTQLRRCDYLDSRVPMIAQVERPGRFEDGICVEGVR